MEESSLFSLTNKSVLVTGASSGIGQAIAVVCAKMGAKVIVTGRNEERLLGTFKQLLGTGHFMCAADLTKDADVEKMVNAIPVLDGVVHCAGVGHRKICRQINSSDIDVVMESNFKAPVLLQTSLLAKKKIAKGASIVFICSAASESPSTGNAVYSASKAALQAYAKVLAIELAPRKIRVNTINPAMVWTDLILKDGLSKEDLINDEQKYLLKRYGTPKDVAPLAVYLLSDASSWMTESSIKITGGERL